MIIFKCLIIVLTLFILPELLGLLILKFWKKEKNNVILALILGYIIEFAIAQLITVPLIFCNCTYKTLLIIYTILLLLLGILSLILNFKNFKEMFKCVCEEIKKLPKILTIICGILVILQIYMYIGNYIHTDNDDAYYVGTATTSIATNTIFKFSPTTGGLEGEQNILRYRLGPFPIYYAFISSWTNIHPAIIAHAVLPIFLILIVYSIYILVGYELFNKDLKAIMMFVLLLNFINIFGNYSVRTTFSFYYYAYGKEKQF